MRTSPLRWYAALAVLAVLAACSDEQPTERADAPLPVSTAVTDAQIQTTGDEYAKCIADHGVRDMPRPAVQAGRLAWGNAAAAEKARRALANVTARQACQPILDPLPADRLWAEAIPPPASDNEKPVLSPGCGRPAPIGVGTSARRTVVSAGVSRTYLLHLPRAYAAGVGVPVVLAFHGATSRPAPHVVEEMEQETGFSRLADEESFVVVYPRSTTEDGTTAWNIGGKDNPQVDDIRFVGDLLDELNATLCVDQRRVYATGFSSGGGLTGILACRGAGRIAAFAAVSGAFFITPAACEPSRPVPILEFHGTSDKVPYEGGPFGPDTLEPIPQWLKDWAQRDQCGRGPSTFFAMMDIIAEYWSRCGSTSTVIGYRILNGQHLWPGAAGATRTVNATTLIWKFFENHRLP